jgi:pimeloyl-ACP methyl ester carboxylesterase
MPSLLAHVGRAIPRDGRGRRRILCAPSLVCVTMLAGLMPVALAAPVAYQDDMICGTDAPRRERDKALREQIVTTPDGSIGYYRFGHGSPIVLVTGYRANMAEWNAYFLGELAKTHDVIVFDNRGIGQSKVHSNSYRIEDLARDTAALIKALNLTDVTVVGWSMGGMVAQQLALGEPSLVDRLVLMSSMPAGSRAVPPSGHVEQILSGSGSAHFETVMDILFPPSVAQRAKQCFVSDMFAPPSYAAPSIPKSVTVAQDGILRRWKQDDRAFDRLHRMSVPVLVLTGTDDEVLSPRNSLTLSQDIPHATLVEVDAVGHAMMYQYPRQLASRISAFIGN